ncbi:MAG: hypothetical protein U9Q04_08125 [Campylobacterota bacterium]|nr:hypothetical protein [Campylobacterota bacterium]
MNQKEELIEVIKQLISIKGEKVDINPKYLEYFEIDELLEIKEQLEGKKSKNLDQKDFLDDIFERCS